MRKSISIELVNQVGCLIRVESDELMNKFIERAARKNTDGVFLENLHVFIKEEMLCTIPEHSEILLSEICAVHVDV